MRFPAPVKRKNELCAVAAGVQVECCYCHCACLFQFDPAFISNGAQRTYCHLLCKTQHQLSIKHLLFITLTLSYHSELFAILLQYKSILSGTDRQQNRVLWLLCTRLFPTVAKVESQDIVFRNSIYFAQFSHKILVQMVSASSYSHLLAELHFLVHAFISRNLWGKWDSSSWPYRSDAHLICHIFPALTSNPIKLQQFEHAVWSQV